MKVFFQDIPIGNAIGHKLGISRDFLYRDRTYKIMEIYKFENGFTFDVINKFDEKELLNFNKNCQM